MDIVIDLSGSRRRRLAATACGEHLVPVIKREQMHVGVRVIRQETRTIAEMLLLPVEMDMESALLLAKRGALGLEKVMDQLATGLGPKRTSVELTSESPAE